MMTKREQMAKPHDQQSQSCGIIWQDNSTVVFFYPCACNSNIMGTITPVFTTRFIDESFVSYHLICHIPLNKTHTVVRHLRNVSSKTENHKCFLVNHTKLSRSISYKVSRLRSPVKYQDFAVLLASPNNCHGVS